MNSLNWSKKVERKLKKLQYVVFKEAGVNCDLNPTKNIVICNAGLVNGLSEEIICEHFLQHGSIDKILLLPGKSCGFVSYKNVSSATNAFDHFNGKLNIAQNNKPVYLMFVTELPEVKCVKSWNELPPGLIIFENFISLEEELELLNLCDFETDTSHMKNRQVKHYGYEFRYDINNVDKEKPLKEPIPAKCNFLWDQLDNKYNLNFHPNQLTINYYSPGQGIPQHVDTHSAFKDPIISLSLLSPIVMEFKKEDKHLCVLLPRRSLAVISGESRYDWTHGISPRKFDIIYSDNNFTTLERGTRISYTFREILKSECNCKYISKCDSYNRQQRKAIIENAAASELEKLHVHNVYENIASHFSNTRHKPWPRVVEFLQSFNPGSILLDVGCGNGKYLGQSNNCFDIGCDQSSELINVCRDRGFEVFTSNCLNLPLKTNIADGAISIAVIHHLATEERRLQALREMVRVLKIGGRALIYVWAKDQCKDEEVSSYIKQDRKNRKNQRSATLVSGDDQVLNILNGVTLPVHSNRTQFKHSDLLVPWKLKTQDESNQMFLRFYHVFQENELNQLCQKLNSLEILHSYYDQGNWCVVIKKIK